MPNENAGAPRSKIMRNCEAAIAELWTKHGVLLHGAHAWELAPGTGGKEAQWALRSGFETIALYGNILH